ncbi:hypothetical protein FGADI_4028 [Fusarium gaditjirri]|uniref:Uncharacterized protein n=1 Tax=Fusarium gaditjirri TaxID=282569 RepID=A0A8H4TEB3_9HYPO|nr:hypothetical protein FGADI_4028 [Fusarium gaditjirri]
MSEDDQSMSSEYNCVSSDSDVDGELYTSNISEEDQGMSCEYDPVSSDDEDEDDELYTQHLLRYFDDRDIQNEEEGLAFYDEHPGQEEDPGISSKRPRCLQTAEKWLQDFNKKNRVPDNDPDVMRFQHNLRSLVERACDHAKSNSMGDWLQLPGELRDLNKGFRGILMREEAKNILDEFVSHMPKLSQKILGKGGLTPHDLQKLPSFPVRLHHRLTYINAPTRVGLANVIRRLLPIDPKNYAKAATCECLPEMETKTYVGSSYDKRGGWARLLTHEREANAEKGKICLHYNFIRQRDVVPFFKVVGVWTNPTYCPGDVVQNVTKWIPVLFEGFLVLYLGLYTQDLQCHAPDLQLIFTQASYDLFQRLRSGLEVPDFRAASLNRAWPLMQGFPYSMVGKCSNKDCKMAAKDVTLKFSEGPLGPGICSSCYNREAWLRRKWRVASLPKEERDKIHEEVLKASRKCKAARKIRLSEEQYRVYRDNQNAMRNIARKIRHGGLPEEEKERRRVRKNELERDAYQRNLANNAKGIRAKKRESTQKYRQRVTKTETKAEKQQRTQKKKEWDNAYYKALKADPVRWGRRMEKQNKQRKVFFASLSEEEQKQRKAKVRNSRQKALKKKIDGMTPDEYEEYLNAKRARHNANYHKRKMLKNRVNDRRSK